MENNTQRFLNPPRAIRIAVAVFGVGTLVFAIATGWEHKVTLVIGAVLTTYLIAIILYDLKNIIEFWRRVSQDNRYLHTYLTSPQTRTLISLYGTFIWNILFTLVLLLLGLHNNSVWYHYLAVYYASIAFMRLALLYETRKYDLGKDREHELIRARRFGLALLLLNLILTLNIGYLAADNTDFRKTSIATIAMAAYTTYMFILTLRNLRVYRRYNSPIMLCKHLMTLITLLVSLLPLETAMFANFGTAADMPFRRYIIAATGIFVLGFTLTAALYVIVKSSKELKKINVNHGKM